MLKTGMIIAERYEIVEKVGSGGMADVYKAKDHKLNRFVAVKVLKSEYREDKTFISKFKSEAQAAAGLTHPNIVNVFDVGDDEGIYYIVMELIEGITLKEYISKKGKLSIKEATSIAIQVSMGLEAAHSHGIVHRDVKPQNIIISTDGKVKVTDFGIARAASSNTISSNVMGSVHYSSPEQVRGGYSDEKSDIYSLGITLYEMVTGRVPFAGDTTVAIAIKHLQEEMVAPSIYTPELPYSLEQIIYKCTQKSTDRRYENMEEVIADLKHSLIDPQGDFVKLNTVDNSAKTVVISEKELGEIKQIPKTTKQEALELMKELSDDDDEEYKEKRREEKKERAAKRKKKKNKSRLITIIGLLIATAALLAVLYFGASKVGLIGGSTEPVQETEPVVQEETKSDMTVVPDIVGKTVDEAQQLASEAHIGIQSKGEESSTVERGRISSQDIPAGSQVQEYSTLKYYTSKGIDTVTVPAYDSTTTAFAFKKQLEAFGATVNISKEYSETDDSGWPYTEPGYIMSVYPESGTEVNASEPITITVSRGANVGDEYAVPDVVGMTENDAVTRLGKFADVQVVYQKADPSVMEGTVTGQDLEADTYVDPDSTITITVNPEAEQTTAAVSQPTEQTQTAETQNTEVQIAEVQPTATPAPVVAEGTWVCTQGLNTPDGYSGGKLRLELVQEVNGQNQATTIVDGEVLQFPYQLNITGAQGVPTGTLYMHEEVNGTYKELGFYTITFSRID